MGMVGSTEVFFNGSLDDVRIYNRELDPYEVANLANLTQQRATDDLQHYVQDISGVRIADEVGPTNGFNKIYLGRPVGAPGELAEKPLAESSDSYAMHLLDNDLYVLNAYHNSAARLRADANDVVVYAGPDSISGGSLEISNYGATLRASGDSWNAVPFSEFTDSSSYSVTTNTIIEFDYASSQQGTIQGIGFDSNAQSSDGNLFFQVHGTGSYGNLAGEYATASGTEHFEIRVGDHVGGPFNAMTHLVFGNTGTGSESIFSNIRVYESTDIGDEYSRPISYGISTILQESLGVSWLAPDQAWDHIPEGKPGELSVTVTTGLSTPDSSPRIWGGNRGEEATLWNQRNRLNQDANDPSIPWTKFGNQLGAMLHAAGFPTSFEVRPTVRGTTEPFTDTEPGYWFPRTHTGTSVDTLVVEWVAGRIGAYFDAHPAEDEFSLGMDDIKNFDNSWYGADGQVDSDKYYEFVKEVADDLRTRDNAKYADKRLGVLIYAMVKDRPANDYYLPRNVFGYITQNPAQWWDPAAKAADQARTDAWVDAATGAGRGTEPPATLLRYEYPGHLSTAPRPDGKQRGPSCLFHRGSGGTFLWHGHTS